jgi:hypothetical protein
MKLRIAIMAIPITTLCISIWGLTLARTNASELNGADPHALNVVERMSDESGAIPLARLRGWVVESTPSAE